MTALKISHSKAFQLMVSLINIILALILNTATQPPAAHAAPSVRLATQAARLAGTTARRVSSRIRASSTLSSSTLSPSTLSPAALSIAARLCPPTSRFLQCASQRPPTNAAPFTLWSGSNTPYATPSANFSTSSGPLLSSIGVSPVSGNLPKGYTTELLTARGVAMKEGKFYCVPMDEFIQPDDALALSECGYALKLKEICSTSLNTVWRSGRCFCPELNKYYGKPPTNGYLVVHPNLLDSDAQSMLDQISFEVKSCPKFTPRAHPFGRSVTLRPTTDQANSSFLVQLRPGLKEKDDRVDFPGQQGNPEFPARISSVLDLGLGFQCISKVLDVLPSLETLNTQIKVIANDVSFYQVHGELTGRKYLEEFIQGRLPVSQFEENGDATYFLHDINFHVLGFLLLPSEVRELAQRQTRYLLDFIDYFKSHHPNEWLKPEFQLMMERLIENEISRIDGATGNLTQRLFVLLKDESSMESFFQTISKMNSEKRSEIISDIMAITDGGKGDTEKLSVKEFLQDKENLVLTAISTNDLGGQELYYQALKDFIQQHSSEPEFIEPMKIKSFVEVHDGNLSRHPVDAVDLLMKRIKELRSKKEAGRSLFTRAFEHIFGR